MLVCCDEVNSLEFVATRGDFNYFFRVEISSRFVCLITHTVTMWLLVDIFYLMDLSK